MRISATAAAAAVLLASSSSDTTSVSAALSVASGGPEPPLAGAAAEGAGDSFDDIEEPSALYQAEEDYFNGEEEEYDANISGDLFDDEDEDEDYDYDDEEEVESEIIGTVPQPLIIPRDPYTTASATATATQQEADQELQRLQELRRQLLQASVSGGAGGSGKLLGRNKRAGSSAGPGTSSEDPENASNARSNARFDGLKALQKKLQNDVDVEIQGIDSTKADLEAEYAALSEEIAELELKEEKEAKKNALLEEKHIAMHAITEKMLQHEAAKKECDHAMRDLSSKKKLYDECAGDCEDIRTRLDHVHSEMDEVEIELKHLKEEGDDGNDDGNGRRRLGKDATDARIAALKAKQQKLRDAEKKLDLDEEMLVAEKKSIHQSVIDRAKGLISNLMDQDETVKHALQKCLKTKIDAEKAVKLAQSNKDTVCAKVKSTAQAMAEAEEDVKKVDEFLKSTQGRRERKLMIRGSSGKGLEL